MAADIDAYAWRDPKIMPDYLTDGVEAGGQTFVFEGAMLADVQAAFGGEMQENFEHRWLCYDAGELRIHFLGNYLQFEEPAWLNLVTVEHAKEADPTCLAKPELADIVSHYDLPGFGATANDILMHYGTAEVAEGGRIAYSAVSVQGDEESWTQTRTVYYRLTDGVVDQVAWGRQVMDNPSFAGWAEGHYRFYSPNATVTQLDQPLFGSFEFSGETVTFEQDTLPDLLARFDRTIVQQGEAGGHVVWGCFIKDNVRLWLTSDGEMGGPENKLMGVTFDLPDAYDYGSACEDAPDGFELPKFDIPLLGATRQQLKHHFGKAEVDDRGHVHYTTYVKAQKEGEFGQFQSLDYRLEGNTVTGVAIGQETGD
jgi:hypothetical protein